MRALSLFSGIEGFGLGFERAGMQVIAHAECEFEDRGPRKGQPKRRQCNQELLACRFPGTAQLGDVRTIDADTVAALRSVDLICGGFPCQDLSVAGRRAGLAGARSGLWWEFHRILALVRPRWVVVENVPGLLSSNDGRDMGALLWSLGDLGYGFAYRVLDAQHFGLAQRRPRVFIVGCFGDAAGPAQVLLEPEGGGGHPAARRQAAQELAGTLGAGSAGRGWSDDTDRMTFVPVADPLTAGCGNGRRQEDDYNLVGTLDGCGGGADENDAEQGRLIAHALTAHHAHRNAPDSDTLITHALTAGGADASEDGTGRGTPLVACPVPEVEADVAETLRSHPRPGSATTGPVIPLRANGAAGANGAGIGAPGAPSLTLDTDGSAALAADIGGALAVRRLTPRECERLQGFPDDWTEGFADSVRYRMLGNAVPVPVAEWVGRRIVAVETGSAANPENGCYGTFEGPS